MNPLLVVLLPALIAVESGGDANAVGDHGRAIGVLQLHAEYVADVNRIAGTKYRWPEDARDPGKSRAMVEIFLRHYGTEKRLGRKPTLQDLARIHNGGGNGYKKPATKKYWNKINHFLFQEDLRVKNKHF